MRTPRRLPTASDEFQVLQSLLTNRTKRHRHGKVLVQGVRPVNLALAHGWQLESLLYPSGHDLSRWARNVVDAHPDADKVEVAPELFRELSQKDEPGDLLAVVRLPKRTLRDIAVGPDSVVVVLDRPANPGNLGTIIRTCDAFGASAVIVTGHASDPYDPAAVRASTGSLFAVPVVMTEGVQDVTRWLEHAMWQPAVIGTDEAGIPIHQVKLVPPVLLLFGNETAGLSRIARDICDTVVGIPISGSASSLNVATAAGIVLYEVARHRR